MTLVLAAWLMAPAQAQKRDPARFDPVMAGFAAEDAANPSPPGAVLVTGSSTIRLWPEAAFASLAPAGTALVRRGFGGAYLTDLDAHFDTLFPPHRPSAIVIYAGENDIADWPFEAGRLADHLRGLLARLDALYAPRPPVLVLSVKPSLARWPLWPRMAQANADLAALAHRTDQVDFLDISAGLLGADGTPDPALFAGDRLHLSQAGYDRVTPLVRAWLAELLGR